jgi:ribosome-binding factor A
MSARRLKKINELIKQEVGRILQKEIHRGNYLITITSVDTADDLKTANINISILPYDKEEEAVKVLKNNIAHIQRFLNKKIRIKFVPKINFQIDKGAKSADMVDLILSRIKR